MHSANGLTIRSRCAEYKFDNIEGLEINMPKKKKGYVSDFEVGFRSSSVYDCTGMMPTPPQNDYECNSYEEVYDFMPPDPNKKGNLR